MNQFLKNVSKHDTTTENAAITHSTTGSELADQFSKAGSYRDRDISKVFAEQSKLHNLYGKLALIFVFYLRLITRKVKYGDNQVTEKVQKGQGNRDESFKRYLWYAQNHPEIFYQNLLLFTEVGSVKDVYELMYYAKKYNIKIDIRRCLFEVVVSMDEKIFEDGLLYKYLPLQKANSKCKTERSKFRNYIAKTISKHANMSAQELRKLKASGTAHTWQQQISKKMFNKIDFNKVSGKALLNIVSGKSLKNWNLESKYLSWIKSQPVAKFTGYVYELGKKVTYNMTEMLKYTIDKQFEGLLNLNKDTQSKRKIICAVDRSGSMTTSVAGTTAMNIAESLGIYFSSLLEGDFKNWVIKFSKRSEWVKLNGTFCEQKSQMTWSDCPSNTDFQSIIDSFVRTKQNHPDIPESDFPDTLLVVSDMQFDFSGLDTNYEVAKKKLAKVFSQEYCDNFVFIWWDCTGRVPDNQPQNIDEPGGYFMSGFDGSTVSLLLGSVEKKESVEQSIKEVLSQEIFDQITIAESNEGLTAL